NPLAQMASNDYAVGRLVEAVSNSPYWKDTAIFVVEDDAQNGPDHVDAHRSTVFVISPYTKSGAVVHTNYNSVNVVRTIEDILGVNYLGLNDANAVPMSDVFIRQPNLQPYVAPIPGILCQPPVDPTLVPECNNPGNRPITAAVKPLHDGAWWAQATKALTSNTPTSSIRICSIGFCGRESWETTNPTPEPAFSRRRERRRYLTAIERLTGGIAGYPTSRAFREVGLFSA